MSIPFVLALSIALGLLGTSLARLMAKRIGFLDKPDGRRKTQAKPVALGGGLGLLLGLSLTLTIAVFLSPTVARDMLQRPEHPLALLLAAIVICVVGVIDDAVKLRAREKLLGQLVAIAILMSLGGYRIQSLGLLGYQVQLGPLSTLVTMFWFLATINAINLLDGMDGLLGTVGLIAFSAVAWMAFASGNTLAGWVALAMAGSIVGFLIFNLPPASIYLGDSGSMLIGLLLASLSLDACLKGPTTAIVAPVVLLVLPLLDTTAAIIRRKLTGRGIAVADRGHLHHELLRQGLNRVRVLCVVGSLALIAAAGALVTSFLQNDLFAFIAGGSVVTILLASGLFGVAEFRLIRERLMGIWQLLRGSRSVELAVQLQGCVDWTKIWRDALRRAERLNLITAILDVNDPARQEGFHARWDRRTNTDHCWRLELVLRANSKVMGKVSILGEGDTPSEEHLNWARELQSQFESLASRGEQLSPPVVVAEPNLIAEPVSV